MAKAAPDFANAYPGDLLRKTRPLAEPLKDAAYFQRAASLLMVRSAAQAARLEP